MSNSKRRGSPNFHLRLDDTRRAKWQQAADREKRTLSDFIKVAADERAERAELDTESKQTKLIVN